MVDLEANLISPTIALAAATPVVYDVVLNFATNSEITLANTGANPITALSVTRIPRVDGDIGAAIAVTVDVPIAAGGKMSITLQQEVLYAFRLTITSALGSTARVTAVGR